MKELGYCISCGMSDHADCFTADCGHEVCCRCQVKCPDCGAITCNECVRTVHDKTDPELPETRVCSICV